MSTEGFNRGDFMKPGPYQTELEAWKLLLYTAEFPLDRKRKSGPILEDEVEQPSIGTGAAAQPVCKRDLEDMEERILEAIRNIGH